MNAQGKRTLKIGITVGLSLGAIVGLVGCGEQQDVVEGHHEFGLSSSNGLSANGLSANGLSANGLSANGLSVSNGLAAGNGLSVSNGLGSSNGLSASNGLMTTDEGRKVVAYLVKCALASSDSLVKQDQNGNWYTFPGAIGLCPAWKSGSISGSADCQNDISACLMAHVNTAGVHIPIWLDSSATAIGWGTDLGYPSQEGTFFGNILATGWLSGLGMPTVNAPAAFYCDGDSFLAGTQGVVAGRLGQGQNNAPYTNPYASSGSLCYYNGGSVPQWSAGSTNPDGSRKPADGYKAIGASGYTFNHAITVWRNPTYVPVFDPGYVYRMMPMQVTGKSVDVAYASQTNGTAVQQYASWEGDPQKFNILASGSNWKITMKANNAKCVGPVSNGTGNGTMMEIQDCNGGSGQAWSVTANASNGAFTFKNVASGRCLDVTGKSTADGARMEIYDCNGQTNQQFKVQSY
jgi:ricin-type beta-trefoil lectin protein/GLTT repeat-containing protein